MVSPEYVIVQDGPTTDTQGQAFYVATGLYQKCGIQRDLFHLAGATLRANILAIMSFSLNRVFTGGTEERI